MKLSILFVLLAAVLWGTTGTTQAFAPKEAAPLVFGAVRMAVGGLTLLLFAAGRGRLTRAGWPVRPLVIAALSMAFYQPFFFSAVSLSGIAVGTVVAIGSAPVLAGCLEWLTHRKIPGKRWWIATMAAICGVSLLFIPSASSKGSFFGILLALGAGLSFAVYTLTSKQLLQRQMPEAVTGVVFSLSAVMLSPLLFLYDLSWIFSARGAGASLYIGVIATAAAYLLFTTGLKKVPASTAVTLSLAEPLTASLLGTALVRESLSPVSWAGIALLLLGIFYVSYTPKKKRSFGVYENV
ncbi:MULTISPECIES: DMT family transporter [Bacillus]|uniref:DMT family transporter n=1 Tax=Bacillus TaxID=1386 RepID=UPI00040A38B2|nr:MULTISPECIES: EamA family transporter [Bacillus]QHZ48587.1 EamA family transporter [Bacillus sp. NSP9.1]WFA05778.1 EamA family transporter [Bacillus sp. HSf4]